MTTWSAVAERTDTPLTSERLELNGHDRLMALQNTNASEFISRPAKSVMNFSDRQVSKILNKLQLQLLRVRSGFEDRGSAVLVQFCKPQTKTTKRILLKSALFYSRIAPTGWLNISSFWQSYCCIGTWILRF